MSNYRELATTVAKEIEDGFVTHEESKWFIDENGDERPAEILVESSSLAGKKKGELEEESRGTFEHTISYGEDVKLRKGAGIILKRLISDEGIYTGEAHVQAACDDYDF